MQTLPIDLTTFVYLSDSSMVLPAAEDAKTDRLELMPMRIVWEHLLQPHKLACWAYGTENIVQLL